MEEASLFIRQQLGSPAQTMRDLTQDIGAGTEHDIMPELLSFPIPKTPIPKLHLFLGHSSACSSVSYCLPFSELTAQIQTQGSNACQPCGYFCPALLQPTWY